ncbi:MAG TPA: outer membrane protein transport protein [Kofleriaceae bacterium]|jgi:long-chain fatty acid transport protein
MKSLFIFGTLVATAGAAHANSFSISEQDAREVGRGNASTATDTNPSAIFYNIAGIAYADTTQVSVGGTFVDAMASYKDPTGVKTDADSTPKVLPQIYATTRLSDLVSVGVGFYLPYGLVIQWPDSSPQNSVIKRQELISYFITPSVAFNFNRWVPGLAAGIGLDLVPSTVELTKYIYFGDEQGTAHLGGNAFGVGGHVGVMYKPPAVPGLSIGAQYKSQIKENYSGSADFDIAQDYRGELPPDGDVSTSITLPQQVALGVAYKPIPALELEVDGLWTGWSSLEEIRIKLPDGTDSVSPQDYKDTITVRAGAEYRLPSMPLALRAGYIYDRTPVPPTTISVQLPDANKSDVTIGASYSIADHYDVNFGALYVIPASQKTSDEQYMPLYKGTYQVSALVVSLSLAGRFKAL